MSNSMGKSLLVTLFILFLLEFHHLYIFDWLSFSYTSIGIVIYLFPIFLFTKFVNKKLIDRNILGGNFFVLYLFFALLNIVICYIYRKQNFIVSMIEWTPLLLIFYYLAFRTWNYSVEIWERVVENLFFVILSLFALKYLFMDWVFIQLDTQEDYLERETRVRLFSDAFLEFGYIYSLNKYLICKKWKYLLMTLIGLFFIFMQGYRTIILMGLIVSALMAVLIYRSQVTKILKYCLAVSIIGAFLTQIPIIQDKIEEIVNRNETQNFDNQDYVRVWDIYYTYNSFFQNNVELVLGAGRTVFWDNNRTYGHKFPSEYSKERTRLATDYHYFPVDLGFLGLSWETGIPFAIVAIILFLYLWKVKVDKEYYYLRCYGLYMVLIGFANALGYYNHNLLCLAIAYTIAEKVHKRYEKSNSTLVQNQSK